MKPVIIMVGVCVLSAASVTALVGSDLSDEVWLGMLGPAAATSTEWVLAERSYRRSPRQLSWLLYGSFLAKMIFFGAYISTLLGLALVRPIPFAASFVGFFVALLTLEAMALRRLTTVSSASGVRQADLS